MEWTTRSGTPVPRIGQGTWRMGERPEARAEEVAALQAGIDQGLTLIDTAEMYARGGAEEVVAQAVRGRRETVFITTKVWPTNASQEGVRRSLEASLRRLQTDAVDLYLLHWPSKDHPLEDSMAGLMDVLDAGLTRHIGVSNFPARMLDEARRYTGGRIAVDQVEYSLTARQAENGLIAYAAEHGVGLMAYSPLRHLVGAEVSAVGQAALAEVARRHGVGPAVVALAWTIRPEAGPMVAIPKASRLEHVRQNRAALDLRLEPEDVARLDRAFPKSSGDLPTEAL